MDKKYILKKLKKYLFFVSLFFLVLSSTNLIYNYIYNDSKEIAQKGGTISESFVGEFPNLNPLKYNNEYNNYINNILYRSLLTYDINEEKIIGDLAKCDLGDLKEIECFLDDNIKWSSGDNIEIDDVIATYNILRETNVNPVIKSTLEKIKIKKNKTSIVFSTNNSDVNIINIFFQSILPKKIIEEIDIDNIDRNFSPINGIYSGKYKISKIDLGERSGFKRIFLEKNEFYSNNPIYIENIILKFYSDYTSLLQQKDNINIFGDKNNLIGSSIPKLKSYKYILPQYFGVFINKDKIEYPNIRNYILKNIDREEILKEIGEDNNKMIESPFLNDIKLNTFNSKATIQSMMNSLGYYKKDKYIKNIETKKTKNYSDEIKIENKSQINEELEKNINKIKESVTIENYNSKSKIITKPSWADRYNFITNPNITLEGNTSQNVTEVYINNSKLENYKKTDKKFSFTLSEKLGNIKNGENIYKIYYVENGRKSLKETISLFYSKDKKNLEKWENDLIAKIINEKINEQRKIAISKKQKEESKKEEIIKKQELSKEDKEKNNLISQLDNRFYYNKKFKAYSITLLYTSGNKELLKVSEIVAKNIEDAGIKVKLKEEKLINITKQIAQGKEEYDLLIAGINLGYFKFNLSKYFYSGQIKRGRNLSKIQNSNLDNILEDLKSGILNKDKRLELQKSVMKILSSEAVFKPLYSPYYSNLVIKNIEGYELKEVIPSDIYRYESLSKSYILKNKMINKENKNIIGFFKFLLKEIF